MLRKFSDGGRMNFSQRYRYNEMAQRYAIYSDLWRKKMPHPRRRLPPPAGRAALRAGSSRRRRTQAATQSRLRVKPRCSCHGKLLPARSLLPSAMWTRREREQVERLYNTLVAAKKKAGENVSGNLDSFSTFVQKKTDQIRKQYGCEGVEFSVEVADGQVKLKAKAKT